MFRFLSAALLVFCFQRLNAQIAVDWVTRHGAYTTDRCNAVCVDRDANVFAAGMFTDTLAWNGQTHIGQNFLDGYIAKLDSTGNQIWLQLALGPDDDQPTHLITLPNGDVLASGKFGDSISIGDKTTHAMGNDDVWLAKLSGGDGSVQWLISVGSIYAYENVGGLVATDDNIFWAVNFGATIVIDTNTFTSQGFNDAVVVKLDFNGNVISTNVLSGSHNDNVLSLAADDAGNVYAGGRFNGSFFSHQPVGGFDMFCGKLSDDGFEWLNVYAGIGSEVITSLTVIDNILCAAGWSNDLLAIGDSTVACDYSGEMLMIGLDLSGAQQWLFHGFPDLVGNDYITATAKACNGDLLFTGYTTYFAAQVPEIIFHQGDEKNTASQQRCAFGDTYLARMNAATGDLLWIKNSLGTNLNSGLGLATDSAGHVFIAGYFTDSLYLKNTAIKGNGGNDAFLFRFTDTVSCLPEIIDTVTNALHATIENFASIFPNPSNGHSLLYMNNPQPNTSITLIDVTGKTLFDKTVVTESQPVPLFKLFGDIAPGVYVVTVGNKNIRQSLKWTVVK